MMLLLLLLSLLLLLLLLFVVTAVASRSDPLLRFVFPVLPQLTNLCDHLLTEDLSAADSEWDLAMKAEIGPVQVRRCTSAAAHRDGCEAFSKTCPGRAGLACFSYHN